MIILVKHKNGKKKGIEIKDYYIVILGIVAIIAVALIVKKGDLNSEGTAALINGEKISQAEIDSMYDKLPQEYQQLLTKEDLLDQAISERLLLQEAKINSISVSEEEISNEIESVIAQSGLSKEEFESKLKEQGATMNDFRKYYTNQKIIMNLLNQTVLNNIEVTEAEIADYYEKGESEAGLDEVHDQIEQIILMQKKQLLVDTYVKQLRSSADVRIFMGNKTTFKETGKEVCKENGKPIIRLFTTTKSPGSEWIKITFDSVIKNYVDKGTIIAHHWQLDKGDDLLTEEKENGVPKQEYALFKEINPDLTVPTFIFGCQYARIGNGYYDEKDLASESAEFEKIIAKLTENE